MHGHEVLLQGAEAKTILEDVKDGIYFHRGLSLKNLPKRLLAGYVSSYLWAWQHLSATQTCKIAAMFMPFSRLSWSILWIRDASKTDTILTESFMSCHLTSKSGPKSSRCNRRWQYKISSDNNLILLTWAWLPADHALWKGPILKAAWLRNHHLCKKRG